MTTATAAEQTAYEQKLALIQKRLELAIADHKTNDVWLFNGGTVLAIAMTTAASVVTSNVIGGSYVWIGSVLAGAAAGVVAIQHALSFGSRWRFHKEMIAGYANLLDKLAFATLIPDGHDRQKRLSEIETQFEALRSRESAVPGAGLDQ